MSGYGLARGYDRRPLLFGARRLARLWPVYACVTLGAHLAAGCLPAPGELVWWPLVLQGVPPLNPSAWTLYIEAWVTLALPGIFLVCRWQRWAGVALACAGCLPWFISHRPGLPGLFCAGAAAAQFPIRWPTRMPAACLWLGRISYGLYLTHWPVMWHFRAWLGPWGAVAALPAVLGVAMLTHHLVERPSIRLSHALGRLWPISARVSKEAVLF